MKAELPKVNVKIERRFDLCHRNFFLAGYEAQKVHLCYIDRWIQRYLDSPLARILISAHSNELCGLAAAPTRYIEMLDRNGLFRLSNLRLANIEAR